MNKPRTLTAPNGTVVFYEISPCSWMDADYGLQVRFSLSERAANAASAFVCRKDLAVTAANATKMAEEFLAQGGLEKLHRAVAQWDQHKTELRAEARAARAEDVARVAKMRADGFTHRVVAWIHPAAGGSDRPVELYTRGRPSFRRIRTLLAESEVKNDYRIEAL